MRSKIYIGNLPHTYTQENIEALFSPHGSVDEVNLIKDRNSGENNGVAFVQMASHEEAQLAIDELDGITIEDREIRVNEAKGNRTPSGGPGGPSVSRRTRPSFRRNRS